MKSLTPQLLNGQQLHDQLQQVTQGIDQAIDWVKSTRQHAVRLDREAEHLTIKLRRMRNKAHPLSETALTAMTIGFVGQSQAGKKHLISALAANEHGRLENTLGGKKLDFWQQIRPEYQTTGLVTRFSYQTEGHQTHGHESRATNEAYPVQLTLLSEVDIAKIIARAFLLDCPQENPAYSLDEQQITEHLRQLMMHRRPIINAGINSDDVIALWDSLAHHDTQRQKELATHFWPTAIELAPYLSIDDRAKLFSLLWGENDPLTDAYRHFFYILQHLSGTQKLLAPLSVLVDDTLLPANGVMNIATLGDLNTPADNPIQVLPLINGHTAKCVTLSQAELTLLAVELKIPLDKPARESAFESVELLNFPDARGSQTIPALMENAAYPLASLLSQAKNAYLLERYTNQQQINLLLVCTATDQRSEIKSTSKALDYWVKQTQGESVQIRSRRNPGLIWALTPHDQRITANLPLSTPTDAQTHDANIKNYDEAVQRYVGNPGDSWGTLLALDARGVERMISYLSKEILRDIKSERLTEQLHELQRELTNNLFTGWYQPSVTDERQQKQRIVEILLKALQTRTGVHGELLEQLLPSRDELRRLYLQQHLYLSPRLYQQEKKGVADFFIPLASTEPFSIGIDIDLFSDLPTPTEPSLTPQARHDNDEAEYAAHVHYYWINHLRQLPDNTALLELLGVTKPTIELLVAEFITASIRLDIARNLRQALADNEPADLHRAAKADRQVSRALTVLGDFIAWLGFLQISEDKRPDSRINRGYKIFAQPPKSVSTLGVSHRLTQLALTPTNSTAFYIYDWLVGLGEMIIQNVGYSASNEISPAQRQQLAAILSVIKPAND
ncbi:virulence factor [Yersinia pestis subsp. microtus bv. Altaica]|uniref:putative virulence factor n=1 Tax=Yersinia pestis TaxID=632 RepID=UPI0001A41980|nr:putative virulence factor [Yersinia pestis]AJK12332.1 bacterial virulence factor family protein [Yersinia pestis str. Pestoides B]AYW82416.1 virulence factor [Yersinia pestis]EEO90084.1 putative virulence factor [Yersinia pestis Pestoides A]KPD70356.1 virulence factor [Yersinia pestis subsp. microtus bv. Altaica]KPD92913.1 virulence factor [Yersinia pestis subsp. microtus bv. Altaica]